MYDTIKVTQTNQCKYMYDTIKVTQTNQCKYMYDTIKVTQTKPMLVYVRYNQSHSNQPM